MRWLLSGGWGAQASTIYPPTYGINLLPMIAVRHLIRDNRVTQIFCTTLSQNHIPASAPPSRAHACRAGGQGIIILTNAITRARGGGVGIRGEDPNLSLIPCDYTGLGFMVVVIDYYLILRHVQTSKIGLLLLTNLLQNRRIYDRKCNYDSHESRS